MKTEQKSLAAIVNEVLDETGFLKPHEVAEEICNRLTAEEQLYYFRQILPAYVSSKMSYDSPTVGQFSFLPSNLGANTQPTPEGGKVQPHIKKAGKPWASPDGWDKKRLSSGLKPGVWVCWPDFSLEMIVAKVDLLKKRIATSQANVEKYQLMAYTLQQNGVTVIGDLPAKAKAALEAQLGGLPDDE